MANCQNCGCSKISCGCKDTYLTTPPPCPTPVDCPEAQPCSEVFDAQCIIYTGEDILCEEDIVVTQNDAVSDALASIVDYFCNALTNIPLVDVVAGANITITETVLGNLTTYTINGKEAIVVAGDNTTVTSNTVGYDTTYTVNGKEAIVVAGSNVTVTSNTVGNDTTYTVSAINTGLAPWQVIGASYLPPATSQNFTLSANTRIIYNINNALDITYITPATPTVGTEIEFISRANVPIYLRPGLPASNTFIEIWQPGGILTASSAGNTRLFWGGFTTYDVRIKLLCIQNSGGGIRWVVIEQTWDSAQPIAVV